MKANQTSALEYTNLRGGYCSDVPIGEMSDFELQIADNCYWKDGLTSRLGRSRYASITGTSVVGWIRSRINNVWYTILGVETTASGVELRCGTDTAFATLTYPVSATGVTLATGSIVQFAHLDNKVVAVNGSDKPMVIYQLPSATNVADTIERYDTRDMDNADWVAGYIEATSTASAIGGYRYTDDTTDAQDTDTADFQLCTSTITTGFYVGCNHTFNRIQMYTTESVPSVTFAYYYYGHPVSISASETWVSFTPIISPTWTAAGNKIIELNWPTDPTTGEGLYTQFPDSSYDIAGRYCFRVLTVSQPSASSAYCAYLKVDHTQYLSQILLGDKPDTVATHKNHVFLGMGNWMRVSPYNQLTGWRESDKEYFGGTIQQMLTHKDYLCILLDSSLYGITGNSWSNWATQFFTDERGAAGKRGAVVVGDEVYFAARDGIYKWDGSTLTKISKHIATDVLGEDASTCAANNWQGVAWFSYPVSGHVYIFDPDTFRSDDVGDGRVSFYRFPTYTASGFMNYTGASDNGRLMAIRNAAPPYLDRCEYDDVDNISGTTATIPVTIFTKYFDFDNPHQMKTFRRIKPRFLQSSTTAGGTYNLRFYRQDKFGGASYTVATITSGYGTSEYEKELSLGPRMDGKTFALYVNHDQQTKTMFLGFAIEVEGRKF